MRNEVKLQWSREYVMKVSNCLIHLNSFNSFDNSFEKVTG